MSYVLKINSCEIKYVYGTLKVITNAGFTVSVKKSIVSLTTPSHFIDNKHNLLSLVIL